jgi:hypothetical protein
VSAPTTMAFTTSRARGSRQPTCWTHLPTSKIRPPHRDWLYCMRKRKTTEGCAKNAMDGAAENGHLEVVKWLSQNQLATI